MNNGTPLFGIARQTINNLLVLVLAYALGDNQPVIGNLLTSMRHMLSALWHENASYTFSDEDIDIFSELVKSYPHYIPDVIAIFSTLSIPSVAEIEFLGQLIEAEAGRSNTNAYVLRHRVDHGRDRNETVKDIDGLKLWKSLRVLQDSVLSRSVDKSEYISNGVLKISKDDLARKVMPEYEEFLRDYLKQAHFCTPY